MSHKNTKKIGNTNKLINIKNKEEEVKINKIMLMK